MTPLRELGTWPLWVKDLIAGFVAIVILPLAVIFLVQVARALL